MLAARPMLCFAAAVMAGAALARLRPETAAWLSLGWIAFAVMAFRFVCTPRAETPPPDNLPDGYAPHILPRPGFFARRGLNRFIIIACVGFALIGAHRQIGWERNLSTALLPENRWFDATLLALAPRRDHGGEEGVWRIPALLLTADGQAIAPVRVRLSGADGSDFRRGDVVAARVRRELDRPKPYPGAFDFRLWMERDGLAASLFIVGSRRNPSEQRYVVTAIDEVPAFTRVRRMIDGWREAGIGHTLRNGGEQGPMLAAMIYGYRKDMNAGLRDVFRRVGIGHVLAISGLHVGLIVGLLWWASGWLGWSSRWRASSCLVLAIVYLGLSGGQAAAARATVMAVIHLGGIAWGRRGDMLNSLGAAAFFLTLVNPSSPMDISFQLSFTAVAFIYLGLRSGAGRGRTRPELRRPAFAAKVRAEAWSLTRLSIATWFGLFPIVALAFNQVNLVGLPINIFVIPFMSVVLACGLLLPLLGWIPGLAWLLRLPAAILTLVAAKADELPYSSLPAHAPAGALIFGFYLFCALLPLRGMIGNDKLRRRWSIAAWTGIAASFICMASNMASLPPPPEGRIAALPGSGFGAIVAESPEGGIALVGTLTRNGIDAAGWLHHLRRGGKVAVAAVGGSGESDLAALSFHYPQSAFSPVPAKRAPSGEESAWNPVPGAPGVSLAVSRDAGGNIAWLAVRAGKRMLCATSRMAARQFTWRLENRIAGFDADLFCVSFADRDAELPLSTMPMGWVALGGRFREPLPERWTARRKFGALVVEKGISGFDGAKWAHLRENGALPFTEEEE